MANPFEKKLDSNSTVAEIVKGTTNVDAEGNVSFRCALGKGSGRPVEIPSDQFADFVDKINALAGEREAEAAKERAELAAMEGGDTNITTEE